MNRFGNVNAGFGIVTNGFGIVTSYLSQPKFNGFGLANSNVK
jgi:hypothetical protein